MTKSKKLSKGAKIPKLSNLPKLPEKRNSSILSFVSKAPKKGKYNIHSLLYSFDSCNTCEMPPFALEYLTRVFKYL